jgi:hypothetical protein
MYSSLMEVVAFPMDTIKTLLYADTHKAYKNAFDCIEKVI